jgi:hypothetical protein
LTIGVALAAYGLLAASALRDVRGEQVAAREIQLQAQTRRQQALTRQRLQLEQVQTFEAQVADLRLQRSHWLFYSVNVQGAFSFEAARQLIEQCSDSEIAYYWPIELEIQTSLPSASAKKQRSGSGSAVQGDVQLSIKGQFVARKE